MAQPLQPVVKGTQFSVQFQFPQEDKSILVVNSRVFFTGNIRKVSENKKMVEAGEFQNIVNDNLYTWTPSTLAKLLPVALVDDQSAEVWDPNKQDYLEAEASE